MSITNKSPVVQINLEEMERDLPAIFQLVENGETLVLMKTGKPVAELRTIFSTPIEQRPFGLCAEEFTVPDDFDEPLPENFIRKFEDG